MPRLEVMLCFLPLADDKGSGRGEERRLVPREVPGVWKCTGLKSWGLNPCGTVCAVLPLSLELCCRAELRVPSTQPAARGGLQVEGWRQRCRQVPSPFFSSPSITHVLEHLPFAGGSPDVTFSDPR